MRDGTLVLAFLAPPLAWALDLGVGYMLVEPALAAGSKAPLHATTLVTLALAGAGGWLGWRGRRETGVRGFLALGAVALSVFFAMAILAIGVTHVGLGLED